MRPKIITFPLVRLASAAASIIIVALVVYLLTSPDGEMSQEPMSAADVAVYSTVAALPTATTIQMQTSIGNNTLSVPAPQEARDSDDFVQQAPIVQVEMDTQDSGYADDETAARSVDMPDTVGNNGEGNFYMEGTPDANIPLEPMMGVGGGLPGDAPPEAAMEALSVPTRAVMGTPQLAMLSPSPESEMDNIQSASAEKDGTDIEREESAELPSVAMLDMQMETTEEADLDQDGNVANEQPVEDAESAQEDLEIISEDDDNTITRLGVTLLVVGGGTALIIVIYTILRRWRTS